MLTQGPFLHTEALPQRNFFTQGSLYTAAFTQLLRAHAFTQKLLRREQLLHKETFTQSSLYAEIHVHTEAFTQQLLTHKAALHRSLFTQGTITDRGFDTAQPVHRAALSHRGFTHKAAFTHRAVFTHRRLYIGQFWCTEAFGQRSVFTKQLLHRQAFTHRSCCTQQTLCREKLLNWSLYIEQLLDSLHKVAFTQKPLQTAVLTNCSFLHTGTFPCRSFYARSSFYSQGSVYTHKLSHRQAFTQSSFYKQKRYRRTPLHTDVFTQSIFCTQDGFYSVEPSFRAKTLRRMFQDPKFTSPFWMLIPHLIQKGCAGAATSVFTVRLSFCATRRLAASQHFRMHVRRGETPHTGLLAPKQNSCHQAIGHPTETISTEGCAQPRPTGILPHVWASEKQNLRRGSRFDGRGMAAPAAIREKDRKVDMVGVL